MKRRVRTPIGIQAPDRPAEPTPTIDGGNAHPEERVGVQTKTALQSVDQSQKLQESLLRIRGAIWTLRTQWSRLWIELGLRLDWICEIWPFGEDWQLEIADLIRAANTVVWLVSPYSVTSKWCGWELGEALRLNKRLMPVVITTVAPRELPAALGQDTPVAGARRVQILDEHLEFLRRGTKYGSRLTKEHTRLADRAREWLVNQRASGQLLKALPLRLPNSWRFRQPANQQPAADVLDLILVSWQEATRRLRYWMFGLACAFLVAVGLTGIATYQIILARHNLAAAFAERGCWRLRRRELPQRTPASGELSATVGVTNSFARPWRK